MPSGAFRRFWRADLTGNCFISFQAKEDQASLRLKSSACSLGVAPSLFKDIHVSFKIHNIMCPAQMAANLGFSKSHFANTFLAPLLDPVTDNEQFWDCIDSYLSLCIYG